MSVGGKIGGLKRIELTHPGLLIWSRTETEKSSLWLQSASPILCPSDKVATTYPFDLLLTPGHEGHLVSV